MNAMPMGGAHAMTMAWAPLPGQTWLGAVVAVGVGAATFEASWIAMMAAMMLPSAAPALWRVGRAIRIRAWRPGRLTALVGLGYLAAWGVVGAVAYPFEIAAMAVRHSPLSSGVPIAVAVVVLAAGALQLTAWKARHLACWRAASPRGRDVPATPAAAWRYGLRLGAHCVAGSAGLTAVLLAAGLMDLRVMAAVTAAITAERLARDGVLVARVIGGGGVCAGLILVVHALAAR